MSRPSALSPLRRRVGYTLAVAVPVVLSIGLIALRGPLTLTSDALAFVLGTVVVALVGGRWPALLAAACSTASLGFFFTAPRHAFSIADPNDALSVVVFFTVAVAVSSVVDIASRRRQRADSIAAEAAALAEVDRLRTALLQAVSHDLRSPLATAKTAVSTALSAPLDEQDAHNLLTDADASLDRLDAVIANLLDLSRLEAGALPSRPRATELTEVVITVVSHLDHDARVMTRLPDDLPDVLADPGLLDRILANLIGNALEHATTPVLVEADVDEGQVQVRIVDHGPGILPERHARLFTPFQHDGDARVSHGIGLGLALSRGLAEAMGGSLDATTTPGGGVTMSLRLLVAP
ncbi:MAG: DUF4118 domain-containing protein [Aeromicrobium sp.]|uniref:sensor histidine kinase n=1 Tax=Aeromicrobium sp. TaxID=1871063 RepID=UPI0039E4829E